MYQQTACQPSHPGLGRVAALAACPTFSAGGTIIPKPIFYE